jgi:RNA polymerase sigma-70 factor, ECF subfamily
MENLDEQDLIQSILDGNTQAFSMLLKRHQRPIHALIRQVVSNREDAEELTQDVFIKAFRKLDTFKGGSSLSTWLYRIAWNTAISEIRKKRLVYPEFDENQFANLPDETVDEILEKENDEAQLQRLERAIDLLNPEEKALITLYYSESKPMAEVAMILNLSPDNAKVKLHRTRKKIVLILQKDENK